MGVFPTQQVDQRLTWGVVRAQQKAAGLSEWGARGNGVRTWRLIPRCVSSQRWISTPIPFQTEGCYTEGQDPHARGSAASRALYSGPLRPAKWRQGCPGAWEATVSLGGWLAPLPSPPGPHAAPPQTPPPEVTSSAHQGRLRTWWEAAGGSQVPCAVPPWANGCPFLGCGVLRKQRTGGMLKGLTDSDYLRLDILILTHLGPLTSLAAFTPRSLSSGSGAWA